MARASTIKSVLQILRRDAGLDGDAPRFGQLAWLVFLKALDDHETEQEIVHERYVSPIPPRLRWRAWATGEGAVPASALLDFIRDELRPGLDRIPPSRDAAATLVRQVARAAPDLMRSGAVLREAITALDAVDFNNLSARRAFREELLLTATELRLEGAPEPPPALARFIIEVLDPELGETILDPSCGAGVFLVAAAERLRRRWVRAPEHEVMIGRSIVGSERSALGFLLSTTNLLLQGVVAPGAVQLTDALARPLAGHGPQDRADVVVGLPPLGGVASAEVTSGFPPAFRTTDEGVLHLVLAMHLLRPGGRAALVLPDAALSREGIMARARAKLLEECEVHTIVRLPAGLLTAAPSLRLNVVFFTQGRPTREVWFYEHHHPEGLRAYSKRSPLRAEDLDPLRRWWSAREEGEAAFRLDLATLKADDHRLDRRRQARLGASPAPRPPSAVAELGEIRVNALRLRDFRGFASLDCDLPATGPAVIIGANGAGKSSLLDAIACLLSPLSALISGQATRHADVQQLGVLDVRVGEDVGSVGLAVRVEGEEQFWEVTAHRQKETVSSPREMAQLGKAVVERMSGGKPTLLPVLCYYPATRALGDEGGKRPAPLYPQLEVYDRAFRRGPGPFHDFVRWFRLEEGQENEVRLRQDPTHRNPRLEIVRRALQQFLGQIGAARYSDLRIDRSGDDKEGVFILEKDKVPLRIEQLSEGERNVLLLVSDIARRLSVANPGREDPLRGSGIVLIDELDLHLHPSWQRGILPALGAVFPGIQLIVSTHSPQVLCGIKREQVLILEEFSVVRVTPYTYGRDSNSILGEVFGVPERVPAVEEKIHRAAVLLDKEDVDGARAAIAELETILGEHDAELVRLRTVLSFVETPVVD